jgi:hypothetical protein
VKERDDLMSATRHAVMMLRHARSDDFTRSFNCDIVLRRHVRAKPRSICNHGRPILCQPGRCSISGRAVSFYGQSGRRRVGSLQADISASHLLCISQNFLR